MGYLDPKLGLGQYASSDPHPSPAPRASTSSVAIGTPPTLLAHSPLPGVLGRDRRLRASISQKT